MTNEQLIDRLGMLMTELLAEVKHLRGDLAERPSATSSCEIKTSTRGADVTVKSYHDDITEACDMAMAEYVRVVAELNQQLMAALNK